MQTSIYPVWRKKAEKPFQEHDAMILLPVLMIKLLVFFLTPAYILELCSITLIQHLVERQSIIKA